MVEITPPEAAALASDFSWFSDFGAPAPTAVATLSNPQSGAVHFVTAGKKFGGEIPRGAKVLISMDTEKPKGVTAVRVPDPKACIGDLLGWLRDFRTGQAEFENRNGGRVGDGASIPNSCKIEPGTVIWPGVVLGEDCRVGANAVLYDGVRAGDRCRFFSTCVVGADGFGSSFRDPSNPQQLAHLGGVEIGDDVDIGGGTVVVAGTIDPTQIGAASKIDARVLVGHNVEIGRSVMVCGGAVIGGSASIKENVWVSPGAVIRPKLAIGAQAVIGLGAMVMKPVGSKETVMGDPASEIRDRIRRENRLNRIAVPE